MTYLAVPIAAQDLDQAKRQVSEAIAAGAEMLELRTDCLEALDVGSVTALIAEVRKVGSGRVPVIVTCRDPKEGGARIYPDELRLQVLRTAIEAGADFIDLECANFVREEIRQSIQEALAAHPAGRLILSAHDFQRRFRNIRGLYEGILQAHPGAIPKLVYTANHINDCFEAFDLLHESEGDCIVLCMGGAGLISRILAKKLGGFVTFASIDEQAATAPGQLTASASKQLYRHDSIDHQTELFGVIADPVGHSLSPAIHNASFTDQGVNGLYLPLLVQGEQKEFDAFLDNVLARPWLGFRGFSVTIPHKRSALEYVRRKGGSVEPLAEQIGAANTLLIERRATSDEPRLSAFNTDYAGALDAITQGMGIQRADLRGVPVAVVGAGGVSRAIVAGLVDAGAKVTIYNRTVERAQGLAADFHCRAAGLDELRHLDAKLVVNCTSIGMHPNVDATPIPAECLKPDMMVFDTVYNPPETLLLKQARQAGAKAIDGIAMFVNQAAAQFHLFTGQSANVGLMRKVVLGSVR